MLMILAVDLACSKLSETSAFRTKLLNPTPPKLSNQQVLLPHCRSSWQEGRLCTARPSRHPQLPLPKL